MLAAEAVFSKIKMDHFLDGEVKWSSYCNSESLSKHGPIFLTWPTGQSKIIFRGCPMPMLTFSELTLPPPIPWPWPWLLQFKGFEKTILEYERGTLYWNTLDFHQMSPPELYPSPPTLSIMLWPTAPPPIVVIKYRFFTWLLGNSLLSSVNNLVVSLTSYIEGV